MTLFLGGNLLTFFMGTSMIYNSTQDHICQPVYYLERHGHKGEPYAHDTTYNYGKTYI